MPTKNPKYKSNAQSDKPKRKISGAQIAFSIFAALLIITMLLSLVSKF